MAICNDFCDTGGLRFCLEHTYLLICLTKKSTGGDALIVVLFETVYVQDVLFVVWDNSIKTVLVSIAI